MNRVKQVVVTAKPPQELAGDGYVLRERRLGTMTRTFVVPNGTTVRFPARFQCLGATSRTRVAARRHHRRYARRFAVTQDPMSAALARRRRPRHYDTLSDW